MRLIASFSKPRETFAWQNIKLEQIAVRLEPALREKLQARADQDQRPLAGLIRKILHDATKQPPAGAAA